MLQFYYFAYQSVSHSCDLYISSIAYDTEIAYTGSSKKYIFFICYSLLGFNICLAINVMNLLRETGRIAFFWTDTWHASVAMEIIQMCKQVKEKIMIKYSHNKRNGTDNW